MISITPQGSVYLCKTPLENDYNHQLTFASASDQLTYFASKVVKTENDYTYLKKDNQIIVGLPIDTIIDCNYLYYKNTGFTTKYYYCFITNMEYVNENATRITIETDVWQTYQFQVVNKECFVEREHVNDDTIGKNLVPEGLETGEFVVNDVDKLFTSTPLTTIIGVTKSADGLPGNNTYGQTVNNIYSGITYYGFLTNTDAGIFIKGYDRIGHADNIYCLFTLPTTMVDPNGTNFNNNMNIYYDDTTTVVETMKGGKVPDTTLPFNIATTTITQVSSLNGYIPKNNKLFTGEFNYIYLTNNSGGNATYFWEDFKQSGSSIQASFKVLGALTIGGSIKAIPLDYKLYGTTGTGEDYADLYSYGLTCGKFPTCSWTNDVYTNWLTQNAVNFEMDKTNIFLDTFANMRTENAGTMFTSVGLPMGKTIANEMATKKYHSFMPTQARGDVNNGDLTTNEGLVNFQAIQLCLRYDFAERIDKYFSAYGYRVNAFKQPNLTGRPYWNYVKTIGCNFEGDIPQAYLQKIKEIFNNGITLWHDSTHFLDYTQDNSIPVTP